MESGIVYDVKHLPGLRFTSSGLQFWSPVCEGMVFVGSSLPSVEMTVAVQADSSLLVIFSV